MYFAICFRAMEHIDLASLGMLLQTHSLVNPQTTSANNSPIIGRSPWNFRYLTTLFLSDLNSDLNSLPPAPWPFTCDVILKKKISMPPTAFLSVLCIWMGVTKGKYPWCTLTSRRFQAQGKPRSNGPMTFDTVTWHFFSNFDAPGVPN